MSEKIMLVTGATRGIGQQTALELARQGARVVLTSRDQARGEAVLEEIRREIPGAKVELLLADLSEMKQVAAAAEEFRRRFPRLDVLVNNAGAIFTRREITSEGLERTFATNHLAPFLLTRELTGLLKQSAPSRVVTVSSDAHRRVGRMEFGDLMLEHGYGSWRAYGQSKLANILFTRELARRLAGTGVSATCLHPGVVATGFARNRPGLLKLAFEVFAPFLTTPAKGARTTIFLASSPTVEGESGGYYRHCRKAKPSRAALDDEAARVLWEQSERILADVMGPASSLAQ